MNLNNLEIDQLAEALKPMAKKYDCIVERQFNCVYIVPNELQQLNRMIYTFTTMGKFSIATVEYDYNRPSDTTLWRRPGIIGFGRKFKEYSGNHFYAGDYEWIMPDDAFIYSKKKAVNTLLSNDSFFEYELVRARAEFDKAYIPFHKKQLKEKIQNICKEDTNEN